MAPPVDKSIKISSGRITVFCVECDNWHSVDITGTARVTVNTLKTAVGFEMDQPVSYSCQACGADVGCLMERPDAQIIVLKLLSR